MKIKDNITRNWKTTKIVGRNLLEFTDAICLTAISGYAITEAFAQRNEFWYQLLLFAGLVVAIQAFLLLVKNFNKQPAKVK